MRRFLSTGRVALLTAVFCLTPVVARAQDGGGPDLDHINVQYYGGPLLDHVRVSTLFLGPYWTQNALAGYLNGFFWDLFADGRYMANLAQYSAGGYQIGNGEFVTAVIDGRQPPPGVTDAQIQAEIRAAVAAGALPEPDPDTLYFVFTPPQVVVVNKKGETSETDFAGYHDYSFDGGDSGFAYAVIPYQDDHELIPGDPRLMTDVASHELAEAVTDPQPTPRTVSWYDERNGEIGDIPVSLYADGRIGPQDRWDVLEGSQGREYLVQKVWSVQDGGPVAFAQAAAN